MSSNKKNSHKGGKVEGPVRHFRISILDNKEIHRSEKGLGAAEATISMKANPIDAAKKLMSSICKHQGLKKMNRLKCNAIFSIKETTRNHSKIYGPYKGKFVNLMKNGKEKIVKLKNGTVIKYSLKPVVKKYKEKNNDSLKKKVNKIMKGGSGYMNINVVKKLQEIVGTRILTTFQNDKIGLVREITLIENLNKNENKQKNYFIYNVKSGEYRIETMNKKQIIKYFNPNYAILQLVDGPDNMNNYNSNSAFDIFIDGRYFIKAKTINEENINNLKQNKKYILITPRLGLIEGIYKGSTTNQYHDKGVSGFKKKYTFGNDRIEEEEIIKTIENNNLFLVEEKSVKVNSEEGKLRKRKLEEGKLEKVNSGEEYMHKNKRINVKNNGNAKGNA